MDGDASSADDKDISSAEDDENEFSSSEGDDSNSSSADDDNLSSADDYQDDTSSPEGGDSDLPNADVQDGESTSDDIPILRPNIGRPNISFELVKDSIVASKLPSFLAQIRAANEELEDERSAGTLGSRRIEIDESDIAAEGELHIEMNLGLGVLEEKSNGTSTTTESDSSNEEDGEYVMEKLLGSKRKRGLDEMGVADTKKAKIQEV